jgi:hypothetical protein
LLQRDCGRKTSDGDCGKGRVRSTASTDQITQQLDGQDLESKPEQVARHDVRVSGQPLVTQQETLTQDFLPAGRYVLAIKYLGKDNWDRKWVFVTVK